MSYRKSNSVRKLPYCATCKNAGQPESVYNGHFPKDAPGGKVVCPTIKGFKCRECGENGHIANEKYCPVLREYVVANRLISSANARAERALRDEQKKKEDVLKNRISVNAFAVAFESDSDSEEEVSSVPAPVTKVVIHNLGKSYKDMLEKPIVKKEDAVSFQAFTPLKLAAKTRRCWADDTSSDEGDD
jgi:Holliday junction resolvase RusA-like endonuclease